MNGPELGPAPGFAPHGSSTRQLRLGRGVTQKQENGEEATRNYNVFFFNGPKIYSELFNMLSSLTIRYPESFIEKN